MKKIIKMKIAFLAAIVFGELNAIRVRITSDGRTDQDVEFETTNVSTIPRLIINQVSEAWAINPKYIGLVADGITYNGENAPVFISGVLDAGKSVQAYIKPSSDVLNGMINPPYKLARTGNGVSATFRINGLGEVLTIKFTDVELGEGKTTSNYLQECSSCKLSHEGYDISVNTTAIPEDKRPEVMLTILNMCNKIALATGPGGTVGETQNPDPQFPEGFEVSVQEVPSQYSTRIVLKHKDATGVQTEIIKQEVRLINANELIPMIQEEYQQIARGLSILRLET